MKFYVLDTQGDYGEEYCFTKGSIDGLDSLIFDLHEGKSILNTKNIDEINLTLSLTSDNNGTNKGAIIGNNDSVLYCRKDFMEYLQLKLIGESVEYLPFKLFNQNKELYSTDFYIVNPLDTFDVLDYDRSEIYYSFSKKEQKDVIIGIHSYVLSAKKLEQVPPLFRLKDKPRMFIVNEELAINIEEKFDNIDLIDLEVI